MADYTTLNWLSDIVLVFEELIGIDLNLSPWSTPIASQYKDTPAIKSPVSYTVRFICFVLKSK